MRRGGRAGGFVAAIVVIGLAAGPVAPARAAAAAGPATVCTVSSGRLDELSGLAVSGDGYVTIDDSSDDARRRRIFYLTSRCKLSRTVSYPSRTRDTEDLALAPDGTLWVADTGDNGRSRETVGLWRLAPGAAAPVLHRFTYPDGAHDAEALLLDGDGTPVIVTKDPFTAGVYVPAAPPRAGATVGLRRAGSFAIPGSSTSNPFGVAGRLVVTGGATAADGSKVALRTYADAFEFKVTDGDVIAAVTTGKAVATPLPDEPQGESVAYTADGSGLLTVSETSDAPDGTKAVIKRYPSALPAAVSPSAAPAAAPSVAAPSAGAPSVAASQSPGTAISPRRRVTSGITPTGLAAITGAAVLVLGVLAFALIRLRRRS